MLCVLDVHCPDCYTLFVTAAAILQYPFTSSNRCTDPLRLLSGWSNGQRDGFKGGTRAKS